MDPVSAIGLTAGIVQLSETLKETISYIKDVKNASKERTQTLQEAASLRGLLATLESKVEYADATDAWFVHARSLGGPGGPLEQFKERLKDLAKKLEPQTGLRKFGKKLIWPLDKSQIKEVLTVIERLNTLITFALREDDFQLSLAIKDNVAELDHHVGNISDNIKEVRLHQEHDARQKLDAKGQAAVNWLSPLNFASNQMDILSRREDGTGQWLLEKEEFKAWRVGDNQTIWCLGMPGAGKTILTAIAVDHLERIFSQDAKTAVVFVYHSYKDQVDHTLENLVGAILQQVVQRKAVVSDEIMTLYDHHEVRRTRPTIDELSQLLRAEITCFSKVFIVVDAIDEMR